MKAVDLGINICSMFLPFSQKSVGVWNKNHVEPWGNSGDCDAKNLWKSGLCGGPRSKDQNFREGWFKFSIVVHGHMAWGGEPGFLLEQP